MENDSGEYINDDVESALKIATGLEQGGQGNFTNEELEGALGVLQENMRTSFQGRGVESNWSPEIGTISTEIENMMSRTYQQPEACR